MSPNYFSKGVFLPKPVPDQSSSVLIAES
uniref:Uncharacterized protein n=1 Tax=Anguilla anguilla TaxID=7936 RepID=A0A0E9QZ85_ANGAN